MEYLTEGLYSWQMKNEVIETSKAKDLEVYTTESQGQFYLGDIYSDEDIDLDMFDLYEMDEPQF